MNLKRFLAVLLSFCLLLSLMAVPALAEGRLDPVTQEEIPLPEETEEASLPEEPAAEAPLPEEPAEPEKGPEPELLLMAEGEDWDFSVYAECPALSPNTPVTVNYDGTALTGALLFTPAVDGDYHLYSEGSRDTWAQLLDNEGNFIASNDDGGSGSNFCINATLAAGTTYVLLSRLYSSGTGAYTVTVARVPDYITSISVSLKPGAEPLVCGEASGSWNSKWDSEADGYVPYYSFYRDGILSVLRITGVTDLGDTVVYNPAFSGDFGSLSFDYDCSAWAPGGENLFTVTLDAYEQSVSVSIPIMTFMDKYGASPALTEGTAAAVAYDGTALSGALLFTPAQEGVYTFTAASEENLGTYVTLFDSDGRYITSSSSGAENGNFLLKRELEAGKTYVLLTRRNSAELSGSYTVTAARVPDIVSFTLTLKAGVDTLYIGDMNNGYWSSYYDYDLGENVPYFRFDIRAILERVTVTGNLDNGTTAELDPYSADYDRVSYSYDCTHWSAGGTENTLTISAKRGDAEASINIPVISFLDVYAGRPTMTMDSPVDVHYVGDVVSGAYFFTPAVSAVYVFTSSLESVTPYLDTYGEVYDDIGKRVAYADGGAENGHFSVSAPMEAGRTYLLIARMYSKGDSGDFTVTATRLPNIKELRLSMAPDAAALVTGRTYPSYMGISSVGYWDSKYDPALDQNVAFYQFSDDAIKAALSITAVYEDDTVVTLPAAKDDPRNELTYAFDCSAWTVGATAGNTVTVTAKLGGATASIDMPVQSLVSYLQEQGNATVTVNAFTELFYDGETYSSAVLFTPASDGDYAIFTTGDVQISAQVLKASGEVVSRVNYVYGSNNIWDVYTLTGGETYILYPRVGRSDGAGDFTFCVTKVGAITALDLALVSPEAALVPGDEEAGSWSAAAANCFYFNADTVFSILELTATFEDGTVLPLPYYSRLISYTYSNFTPGGENLLTVTAGEVSASISVPVQGADDLTVISPDAPAEVEFYGSQNSGAVTFTPEEDGDYWFYSEGDADTKVTVTDGKGNSWTSDDEGSGSNFKVSCTLTAGNTYTVLSKTYDKRAGKYFIRVSQTEPAPVGYEGLKGMNLKGKMINLALVVDTTGSMSDEIAAVRNCLQGFVDALAETGATLRISLIDYKDVLADGFGSTKVHTSSKHSVWFANADTEELKSSIGGLGANGGGDTPESVVDALGCLLDPDIMRFNSNALKFAFLLTDANYWCFNNRHIKGMKDLVNRLSDAGIITSVVTLKEYFLDYRLLTAGTGGVFINIRDDFSDAMSSFAASIAARAADYKPDDDVIPVTSVSLGGDLSIPVGKVRSFHVQVDPVNATNRNVLWEIADTSVAEVLDNTTTALLVIQGKKVGTTEVTARSEDGDYTATFTLTVSKTVKSDDGTVESCDLNEILAATTDDSVIAMHYYADQANNATVPEDTQRDLYLNLIGQDKNLSYIYSDALGDMSYSWTFNGTDITDETKGNVVSDMLIELDKTDSAAIDAMRQFAQADSVDFAHEGALPGKATIQIPVDLDDGTYELWFMNEITGNLEKVGGVIVKDGIATFEIEHCSTYVIVDPSDAVIRVDGKRAGELTALPEGEFTVTIKVKPEISASADRQVFMAAFDAKGRFLSVKTAVLAAGTDSAEVKLRNDGRIASLRGLVVDSLSGMAPQADVTNFAPVVPAE